MKLDLARLAVVTAAGGAQILHRVMKTDTCTAQNCRNTSASSLLLAQFSSIYAVWLPVLMSKQLFASCNDKDVQLIQLMPEFVRRQQSTSPCDQDLQHNTAAPRGRM